MTRPPVVVPKISLPTPLPNYSERHQREAFEKIAKHFEKVQPLQNPETVTGACAGNTAIKNTLTALANLGLVIDNTTA